MNFMKMQLKFKLWILFNCILFMIINQNVSTNIETVNNINNHLNINIVDGDGMRNSMQIDLKGKRLSRQRRYIAFPDGASFSVAICATIGVIGNPNPAFLSYGLNWGVAYDLPNQTWIIDHLNGFKNNHYHKAIIKRRNRRNIYKYIETSIDNMGYNGRHCIFRALCESKKYFLRKGTNMIEEIVRIIFSFPKSQVFSNEDNDIVEYDKAFRDGNTIENCAQRYSKCGFSLIELAFGRYSEPPSDYWDTN